MFCVGYVGECVQGIVREGITHTHTHKLCERGRVREREKTVATTLQSLTQHWHW